MSDCSFDDGQITIDPPLNYAEIKRVQAACLEKVNARGGVYRAVSEKDFRIRDYYTLDLVIEDFQKETDEGIVQGKRAVALKPAGEYLGSSMADDINRVIDLCPGHTFTGEIVAVTEYNQSAVKVVIKELITKVVGDEMVSERRATNIPGKVTIHFEDGTEQSAADL